MYIDVLIDGLLQQMQQPTDAEDLGVFLEQELGALLALAGIICRLLIVIDPEQFLIQARLLTPITPTPATCLVWQSDITAAMNGLLHGFLAPTMVSHVTVVPAAADDETPKFERNTTEIDLSTVFKHSLSADLVALLWESASEDALSDWTLAHDMHTIVVTASKGQPTQARLCATVDLFDNSAPDMLMQSACDAVEQKLRGFDAVQVVPNIHP